MSAQGRSRAADGRRVAKLDRLPRAVDQGRRRTAENAPPGTASKALFSATNPGRPVDRMAHISEDGADRGPGAAIVEYNRGDAVARAAPAQPWQSASVQALAKRVGRQVGFDRIVVSDYRGPNL
jgi:hypothetical protein